MLYNLVSPQKYILNSLALNHIGFQPEVLSSPMSYRELSSVFLSFFSISSEVSVFSSGFRRNLQWDSKMLNACGETEYNKQARLKNSGK